MNFIEELNWRGMIHNIMPGTEDLLNKEQVSGYIGFDPTADSSHVGSLAQIMTLVRFQKCGHKPLALVGGATGMIGDPSGKSKERNLLDEDTLNHNLECIKNQLSKFLDFDCGANSAEIVNNYDWMKNFSFLTFMRDVGKLITVNYMMSKDSVQNRLGEEGMSFTEFSYQLLQGYDFLHLFDNKNCLIQMGGSDQWGNIVTGTELIRKKLGKSAFALTTHLIKKSDGTKFGKTEGGNIWLDRTKTTPYKFYQFWLNTSDDDASSYIRIFTLLTEEEINAIEEEHKKSPNLRILQKTLAKDVTVRVHSVEDFEIALKASEILFGCCTSDTLKEIDEETFLSVFEGVPHSNIYNDDLTDITIIDLLANHTSIFTSKSDVRRCLKEKSIFINKEKVDGDKIIDKKDFLKDKYILIQKGKRNYHIVTLK